MDQRIRQLCGKTAVLLVCSCFAFSGIGLDSPAKAGFLKNSVRVGDRSRMNISRPPSSKSSKRIQVGVARKSNPAPKANRKAQYVWFWEEHLAMSGPDAGRWAGGLKTLRERRDKGLAITPTNRVAAIAERWRDQITAAAGKHNVSETLLLAVMTAESAGKVQAQSHKGAQGLMQLIPATAARFGVKDPFDPAQNIEGGAAYLSWLLAHFDEDPILALAGYNAGENAITKHSGVPPFTETRDYVPKVFDALVAAESLCLVAPAGPRRSCLWREGDS
ncbi:lytic transglycosylase domain-containing protein [Rhodobacteraceae bacterium NNCM2]|nr:lytic transglycosylase domain-containing protein [Coraliihabitans acroporae]